MDIKGKVIRIFAKQQVSEKFAKREFVIATEDKYPQQIIMQATQERCELLDNIAVGEEVQVFFNIRGRSWTNPQGEEKFFVSLDAWKITNESAQSFDPMNQSASSRGGIEQNFIEDAVSTLPSLDDEDDGLPF